MKYIDRKGNITIEENEQDKFLRHLYNDRGGRLCLKLLIRPFVSKAAGAGKAMAEILPLMVVLYLLGLNMVPELVAATEAVAIILSLMAVL